MFSIAGSRIRENLIGYLVGAMRSVRQASHGIIQLEQARQALSAGASQHEELQERLRGIASTDGLLIPDESMQPEGKNL